MTKVIDQLIINKPYEEPGKYWTYIPETQEFLLKDGRRRAGYYRAGKSRQISPDDPGEFVEIKLVEQVRPRVRKWKENGYPGVTGVTKKLLSYWYDKDARDLPFFWCQLEAIETAIWLTEASPADKQGIEIPKDGEWERQCLKMATGTGKTVVMALLISWQALNKLSYPKDSRFSKNILIVAPGITVRDRLQVLYPDDPDNYYEKFNVLDTPQLQELYKANIFVTNWHSLAPINENYGPKVVKKGPESNEAFVQRVLPSFDGAKNILVINDEAHHCHRPTDGEKKSEKEKATIWVSGIDRINYARGVLKSYDLTATPFKPSGRNNQTEKLFSWVVSDFSLNDAIESGLVKTPKVAVRDDSVNQNKDFVSKLFHIYPEVKDDLVRRAEPHEGLPDLVRNAINILGADWLKTREDWDKSNIGVPPVLIMIANRTETSARLDHSLSHGSISVPELSDSKTIIRIDQDALDKLEAGEEQSTKSKQILAQEERDKFNTVGQKDRPGENVQCVIGVNMLSEGWDAKTVTHILGLRAFTSQLLCEQVIGRGLRRINYDVNDDGFLDPDYVTVFGVPFTYLPVEQKPGPPRPQPKKTKIEPIPERKKYEITWPHVIRVDHKLNYFLDLDWDKLDTLVLSPDDAPTIVEVAPVIEGKPRYDQITELDLKKIAEENRLQRSILQAAVKLEEQFGKNWEGDPGSHVSQAIQLINEFIKYEKLQMKVPIFKNSGELKQILVALNLQKIINHIANFIRSSSKEEPTAILDPVRPKRSTATSPVWYTSKPAQPVKKSQISHIVIDSNWESVGLEFERDRIPGLISWAKNDHLGFEIYYFWQGQTKTYYTDFILKFKNNRYLILEVKGQKTDKDKAKFAAAQEWVRAVNTNGQFGKWEFKVLEDPKELHELLKQNE